MVLDACRQDASVIVVISNDSDLAEPLRIVKDELGITTVVVNPHPAAKRSRAMAADIFKQLRGSTLAACQLPMKITDQSGRVILKPAAW